MRWIAWALALTAGAVVWYMVDNNYTVKSAILGLFFLLWAAISAHIVFHDWKDS